MLPSRRTPVAHLLRTAAAALLLAAAARAPGSGAVTDGRASPQDATHRMDGEYGLYVRIEGDSIRVGWITASHARGMLQVVSGDAIRLDTTTAADSAHVVAFGHASRDTLTLRYGSAEDSTDRHVTTIDPRVGVKRPPVRIEDADRVFVLGDTHGEFDTLTAVLRAAGVVDHALHWIAGDARLVVLGDVTDRGADVTRALWFLYRLEREAAQADGGVHLVLGNHELMVMLGDVRYVAPKELTVARLHGVTYDRLFDPRHAVLGRWLASRPALIRIEDALFVHGGVSPAQLNHSLQSIDDSLATFAGEELFYRWADTSYVVPLDSAALARRNDFFWDASSLFWYRGYAQADTLGAALDSVLDHFDSRLMVVGHTPAAIGIRQAYDGRLIMTNTLPFGQEVLLLTRRDGGWQRERIRADGVRAPLAGRDSLP